MEKKILKDRLKARFQRTLVKLEIEDEDFKDTYVRTVSVKEAFLLYKILESVSNKDTEDDDEEEDNEEVDIKFEFDIDEIIDQIDSINKVISECLRYEDGTKVIETEEDRESILEGISITLAKDLFNEILNKCKIKEVMEREQIAKN